jgi:predicted enzyme related to lactoylglutathione lyase
MGHAVPAYKQEVNVGRVIHFELNADDPERAARFYQDVFGWTIEKWDGPLDY